MAESGQRRAAVDSVLRARDIDRAQASTVLDAAYAEGQLGAQEYHDRVASASTARTVGDLARLTADLQSPAVFSENPPSRRPRRRARAEYPAHTRARSSDRTATIEALDTARADGQLDADEHAALAELATEARTLGDLSTLVAELHQRPDAPTKPRVRRDRRRLVVIALASVAAVAAFVVTVRDRAEPPPVTHYNSAAPLVLATPSPTTIAGFLHIRDGLDAKFGNAVVDAITCHPEYARLTREATGQGSFSADYTYYGGFQRSTGAMPVRARATVSIDLATVNTDALAATLADAATTLSVPDGKVQHFSIAADTTTKRPVITIHVGNEHSQSGFLTTTLSGELIRAHPYEEK
ncbi:DUF1707 SHOCT-like domain-containing protein [Nocardia sp. NPDC055165]